MKKDVYNHEGRYKTWKEDAVLYGIDGLTKENSDMVLRYLIDMETGTNISIKNKKGARSYPRLNNLKQRMRQLLILLQNRGVTNIIQVTDSQINALFNDMRSGAIATKNGEAYRSAGDYAKVFASFWHWWMKVNRKVGIGIIDLTEDLDKSSPEGRFVYITKEQLDLMLPYLTEEEQIIICFIFDTLIRAPTELMSMKVNNVFIKDGQVWITIPKEISKITNFERRFNLLYCGDALIEYIAKKGLKPNDYLFDFKHSLLTEKLHKVGKQLFGEGVSDPSAGGKYEELSMYDFRHAGAVHYRILASKNAKITLDSIRQRGGWSDFKMLNYYTKFIGIDGSIDKNDLIIPEDKTKMEKEIEELKKNDSLMAKKFMGLLEILKQHPEEMKIIFKENKKEIRELFVSC